ncbi:MAG: radical SAM protein [Candidatus Parcubacteria bacterium]|nr:radical SAM protein [Candidatus Parcubacteria bacterium]
MILSRYLQTAEKNDIFAIFHSLKPKPIFIKKIDWENFLNEKKDDEITQALTEIGLLVENKEDDDLFFNEIKSDILDCNAMSILYLVLTKSCNFRCKQCFQPERHPDRFVFEKQKSLMSQEIAKRALNLFADHLAESNREKLEPQIQFYGGEPLINFDTLRYSVLYAEELQKSGILPEDVKFAIVTNGSLVTNKIASFFKEHHISVCLSIDGPKEFNDEYRRDAKGSGTYDKIKKSLRVLQKHDIEVTLSITVNPNIVDKLPEIILWVAEELKVHSVCFNPIGGESFTFTETKMTRMEYNNVLIDGLIEAYKVARDINIYEDRVGRKIEDFVFQTFKPVDCGAVYNQMVVYPDGNIGYCHASQDYNIGSVFDDDFRIFKNKKIEPWLKALPIFNPKCSNCPAISICGYGCFHNVSELGQDLSLGDLQFCCHTKKVMEFLIWDLYKKMQEKQ